MSDGRSIWEAMLAKREEWAQQQPSLGAQVQAMVREAARDIRGAVHESFFGKPEHPSELGAPGAPTPQMVTADLGTVHGSYQAILDSYAERGRDAQGHSKEREGFER
jgi:hypothetical protein